MNLQVRIAADSVVRYFENYIVFGKLVEILIIRKTERKR